MNRWIMTDESIINTHYIHRIFVDRPAYAGLYYLKADTERGTETLYAADTKEEIYNTITVLLNWLKDPNKEIVFTIGSINLKDL